MASSAPRYLTSPNCLDLKGGRVTVRFVSLFRVRLGFYRETDCLTDKTDIKTDKTDIKTDNTDIKTDI